MQATITSTTEVVDLIDIKGNPCVARAWEGISAAGVPFTAYVTMVQVRREKDNSEFVRELSEHKAPGPETRRAIDLRFVL